MLNETSRKSGWIQTAFTLYAFGNFGRTIRTEDLFLSNITEEIKKRRTFAIISHPDAGKTTLTEKFLLYGGAINLAGTVKGRARGFRLDGDREGERYFRYLFRYAV